MPVGSRLRPFALIVVSMLGAMVLAPVPGAAAGPLDLWVDQRSAMCSDGFDRQQASSPEMPWCSLAPAAAAAQAGDTVRVAAGRYVGTVRPTVSGRPDAPIRFIGEGATLDAAGAAAALKIVSVTDLRFEGIAVTGAANQGVWVDGAERIVFDALTVEGNVGHGLQFVRSSAVSVRRSKVRNNHRAGIFEGAGCSAGRYVDNDITSNGIGTDAYNGDGVQLGGESAYVARNRIWSNGTPGPYEHGIYAGPSSRGYLIEDNRLSANAGSNIKAAGADGVIRYNRLESGRLGLVFSDNPAPVLAYYNLIIGTYQHAVFLTVGETAARAKLWNNTIASGAPDGTSGDASAVFVKSATSLDLRNNVVVYTSPNNLGIALYVVDSRQLTTLSSNNNWFSTRDSASRHFVRDGARLALSAWRKKTGQDAKSIASGPPTFDADGRIVSTNLGIDRGQKLGFSRDYSGWPIAAGNNPDVGAYETR